MNDSILLELYEDLKSSDKNRRWNAIFALRRLKPEGCTRHVALCLKDEFLPIRRLAIEILGELSDISTMYHILSLLKDPVSGIRVAAVEALGKMNYPPLEKPLREMLNDENLGVRWSACHALAALGTKASIGSLAAILCEDNEMLCEAARTAIKKIRAGRPFKKVSGL
ncbi:HEAT repeat domain-containing protein [Candidatus Riflebacteria bacterium]